MDKAVLPNGSFCVDESSALEPFELIEGDLATGLLLLCDHAANTVPDGYNNLGLGEQDLNRHIGYDIGAGALTRSLSEALGAPAILSNFSRLLIDPNRGEDDPTLIMRLSDGAVVPANAMIDHQEREARLERYYRPYHFAISDQIAKACEAGKPPVLLSIHSYTRNWRGMDRPWHGGVLWDRDPRFAVPLLGQLSREDNLIIGDNEPYTGALRNDTMYRHGTSRGLAHALLEVRNDLIADRTGVDEWNSRLVSVVRAILEEEAETLFQIEHFGSLADA